MSLSRKSIEYTGLEDPATPRELRIEIAGLKNAIRQAEELISRWEQVLLIVGEQEGTVDGEEV